MKIIDRYFSKTLIHTTSLVLLLLVGLSIFVSLVEELGDIGTGDYHFWGVMAYVLLDLPKQLYVFFPMAALLGTLLGLGTMASNSELIVLRASGLSLGQIARSALKAAVIMLLIATVLGEGVAPFAQHAAANHKTFLITRGQTLKTNQGMWVRSGQEFLYIRNVLSGRHLEDISRYQFDKQHKLISMSFAKSGLYTHGHWVMKDIVSSQVAFNAINTQQIATSEWPLALDPDLLRVSEKDPQEMSLKRLYDYITYLKSNNLDASNYLLSFWQRILQPLATLVMIWLAIPFVFGPLRSAAMGLRILLGAVVGFVFYTLNQFFGPLSIVYQFPPLLAAMLPIAIFALTAYGFQRRVT